MYINRAPFAGSSLKPETLLAANHVPDTYLTQGRPALDLGSACTAVLLRFPLQGLQHAEHVHGKLAELDLVSAVANDQDLLQGVHYARTGALFGVEADPDALTKSFKKQWKHLNRSMPKFGVDHHGWEHWWSEAVHRTFIDAGVKCDNKILRDIAKNLIDQYTTPSCWQHCDGSVELLNRIKSERIPLGIVSNFDTRLEKILENMNVYHYFDFILTSYGVGYPKPDRRIFDAALQQHPSLDPGEVLHVGDTPEVDCTGALEAGWNSWLVSTDPCPSHQENEQHHSGTLKQLHDHLFTSEVEKNLSSQ
ncbi:hypothetical protein B566_EDAN012174 [Ephemera danica]|nr:hypothetical protein B566_EDAN012174 [Ephemera danica]